MNGRLEADAVRAALTGALVLAVCAPEARGGRTLDFDRERFENAQARRELYFSPACCPEPLARGVLDGRHHSRYS